MADPGPSIGGDGPWGGDPSVLAPEWVRDEDSAACVRCTKSFTFRRRRHHCRKCGEVVCGQCSRNADTLGFIGWLEPVRTCDTCHAVVSSSAYVNRSLELPSPTVAHNPETYTVDDATLSAWCMDLQRGVGVRVRRVVSGEYRDVFAGKEAVDWLVEDKGVERAEAVGLMERLLLAGRIRHAKGLAIFCDEFVFYQFTDVVGHPVVGIDDEAVDDVPAGKAATDFVLIDRHKRKINTKDTLENRVVLVVNVGVGTAEATNTLVLLEHLYTSFGGGGDGGEASRFEIVAFPCTQFGGAASHLSDYAVSARLLEADVSFLLCDRVDVNGFKAAPMYTWLKRQRPGILGPNIEWNDVAFLISRFGEPVARYPPGIDFEALAADIQTLLDYRGYSASMSRDEASKFEQIT